MQVHCKHDPQFQLEPIYRLCVSPPLILRRVNGLHGQQRLNDKAEGARGPGRRRCADRPAIKSALACLRRIGAHAAGSPWLRARIGRAAEFGGDPRRSRNLPGGDAGRSFNHPTHPFCSDHRHGASVMFAIVPPMPAEFRLAEPGPVRICEELCRTGAPLGAGDAGEL